MPSDYIYFRKEDGLDVFEALSTIEGAVPIGDLALKFKTNRSEHMRLIYEMYMNKLETDEPPGWMLLGEMQKATCLAKIGLNLVEEWRLRVETESREVIAVPREAIEKFLGLIATLPFSVINRLFDWQQYWFKP